MNQTKSRLIDANAVVTVMLYDDEVEDYVTESMTIAECLDSYTEEGCPALSDSTENILDTIYDDISANVSMIAKHCDPSDYNAGRKSAFEEAAKIVERYRKGECK